MQVISFGEVLFDVFEDGARLGGAPLNLAVHLRRLGAEVELISAVGRDSLGERALREIREQNLSCNSIAQVEQPTGTVDVKLDAHKVPSYHFALDTAYDHIPKPETLPEAVDLFCFGTLAQRNEISRHTLRMLLARNKARIFYDVNLRQNFHSKEILADSLEAAQMAKINEEEFPYLVKLFGLENSLEALARRFKLETIILTLGAAGCRIRHGISEFNAPPQPAKVVSTVGAGDAFSAAFLYTLLTGGTPEEAAEAGNRLAARTTEIPGAF